MSLRRIYPQWRWFSVKPDPKIPAREMRMLILQAVARCDGSLFDLIPHTRWVDILRHPQVKRLEREGLLRRVRSPVGRLPSWRGGGPSRHTNLRLTEAGHAAVEAGELPEHKPAPKSQRVEKLSRHLRAHP